MSSVWLVLGGLALAQQPAAPSPEDPPETPPEPVPPDEAAREAELFGEPSPAPAPAPTVPVSAAPSGDRDSDVLGETFSSSEAGMSDRLGKLDERLTLGGRLWLQTTAALPAGVDDPEDVTLNAPNYLDLYVDARPNDRVRAYASGRLIHDWTIRQGDLDPLTGEELQSERVILDQLWTKFDVAHRVFVTAGRQRIRWGASRFWNPTDVLNQARLDPLAIFDVRTGIDLVKVHVPFEALGGNVYLIANIADSHALSEVGGAARAEWAFGTTEITASGALRKDQPQLVGGDLSSGLGPFDVRLEVSAQHGVRTPGWEGSLDVEAFPPTLPTEVDRSEQWWVQTVAGADVSIKLSSEDSLTLGAEYFHNPLGQPNAELYAWLFTQGQFTPLYLGRDYAAVYGLLPGPGRFDDQTLLASVLVNVSDRSLVSRFDWRSIVLTWLETAVFVQVHGGENGEFHYSLTVPPVPGVLPDGLSVPAPLVDVGLSAVVRF